MPSLEEVLGVIAEYIAEDQDKEKSKEVAHGMLKNPATQAIAQNLVNRGISKRAAEFQAKLAEVEAQNSRLKDELGEKDEEIQQIRSEQPNWGKRIEETEKRAKEKQTALEKQLEQEREARRNDQLAIHRQRFIQKLGPGTKVDKEWAEEVLANKYADRIRLDNEGRLEVLEPGENTAYDAASGDPIDLLVQDVLKAVPGRYRIMGTPQGGGGEQQRGTGHVKVRTPEEIKESLKQKVGYAQP